jgi:hypothetical protein
VGQRAFSSAFTRSIGGIILPIPPNTYHTTFPATENPLSEGGRWISGGLSGIYGDVQTVSGQAFGTVVSPSPPYTDPTAVLAGAWGPLQTAEAVVKCASVFAQNQEVELRLLTQITPRRIVGYEFLWSVTNNPYREIVRWDTDASNGAFFSVTGGAVFASQIFTGMRIKATVSSAGLLTLYTDYGSGYVQEASGTDTNYRSGSPGLGMFQHAGSTSTLPDFGLTSYSAWSL